MAIACKRSHSSPSGDADDVDVYILSEPPSAETAAEGRSLSPSAERMIERVLPRSIRYRASCVTRAAMQGKNKELLPTIQSCSSKVIEDIEKTKPRVVVGMGFSVLPSVLPGQSNLAAWRGFPVPVTFGAHACWFIATYSHAYCGRDSEGSDYESKYAIVQERDLKRAVKCARGKSIPVIYDSGTKGTVVESIGRVTDLPAIKAALNALKSAPVAGLDIETTALRPYTIGGVKQRILSIAISDGATTTVCFPLDHPKAENGFADEAWGLLSDYLAEANLLVAHNLKFELLWLSYFMGRGILDLSWADTMALGYVISNRKGGNSLAFNTMRYLGVNVKELTEFDASECLAKPIELLITYNSLDAYWTTLLYHEMIQVLPEQQGRTLADIVETTYALTYTELQGEYFDVPWTRQKSVEYTKKLANILASLRESLPGKQFVKRARHLFDPGCDKGLKLFLCDIIGEGVTTSFDEAALKNMATKYAGLVIDYRKTQKITSTYLDGWLVHVDDDGIIHPTYNVCRTATNRLSSSSPNAQNAPKRGVGKWVRRFIKAPPGMIMASLDYAQVEARVIGALSNDPVYVAALWDGYDIHMHWTKIVAAAYPDVVGGAEFLNDPGKLKALRQEMKSGFVFALLFGAGIKTVSGYLNVPIDVMSPIIDRFWREFAASKRWQQTLASGYKKSFFVETVGKFRRYGPLSYNDIINTPVQGTAAEIAKYGICEITKKIMPIHGTVHDSIEFFLPEKGYEQTLADIAEIMCMAAIRGYGLDNVPWAVEAEVGDDWAGLEAHRCWSSRDFGHVRRR